MTERRVGTQEERLAAGEEPMPGPVFTETMQVGIVMRDLNAAMRRYVDYDSGFSRSAKRRKGGASATLHSPM